MQITGGEQFHIMMNQLHIQQFVVLEDILLVVVAVHQFQHV